MRAVLAGFRNSEGQVEVGAIAKKDLDKANNNLIIKDIASANFIWAAAVNKYFAAILVPMPDEEKTFCDWILQKTALLYNPDGDSQFGPEACITNGSDHCESANSKNCTQEQNAGRWIDVRDVCGWRGCCPRRY